MLYYIIDNTNGMDCAFDDMSCYTADPCRIQIVSRNSDGQFTICLLANTFHSCLKSAQRYYINCYYSGYQVGRVAGSVVGIATTYGAGQSGDRIPVAARFSAPVQTGPEAHKASCTMVTGSFPGVRCGRDVTLNPHPFLVPKSKIE